MLVQPGESGPAKLLHTGGGYHPIIGLKQWLDDDTELPPS